MTFISYNEEPTRAEKYVFVFVAAASIYCAYISAHLGRIRKHYHLISTRILFPASCLILAFENLGLFLSDKFDEEDILVKVLYAMHALIVPIWLEVAFEVCYLIHKRRSVNWCGIYFDEGRRVKTNLKSFLLRNCILIVACCLLIIGVAVNFDLLKGGGEENMAVLVGRAGWYSFWSDDGSFSSKRSLFLSLMPVVVLFFISLHLSIAMWRYGTSLSLVVYPSYFNPWCKQFIGTLLLGAGQLFGDRWYTAMSNIGQVSFVLSIILEMKEVDKELVAEADFEEFLNEVEAYGDRISIEKSASDKNGKTSTALATV